MPDPKNKKAVAKSTSKEIKPPLKYMPMPERGMPAESTNYVRQQTMRTKTMPSTPKGPQITFPKNATAKERAEIMNTSVKQYLPQRQEERQQNLSVVPALKMAYEKGKPFVEQITGENKKLPGDRVLSKIENKIEEASANPIIMTALALGQLGLSRFGKKGGKQPTSKPRFIIGADKSITPKLPVPATPVKGFPKFVNYVKNNPIKSSILGAGLTMSGANMYHTVSNNRARGREIEALDRQQKVNNISEPKEEFVPSEGLYNDWLSGNVNTRYGSDTTLVKDLEEYHKRKNSKKVK